MPRRSIRSSTTRSTRSSIATYRRPSNASRISFDWKMRTRKSRKSILRNTLAIKSLPKMNMIFPPHKLFKLPYSQTFALAPSTTLTSVIGATQQFILNGLYDPDITGTGHQPLYRDTLLGASGGNAPYGRYKVLGCYVHIKWYDPKDDGTRCFWRIMNPTQVYNSETMAGQDADYAGEKLNTNSLIINNSGSQVRHTRFFLPMYKGSGLTKLQFNADPDNFTASYDSNPGSKIYLELGVSNSRSSNLPYEVVAEVNLEYHAILYGRNTPVTS